MNFLNTNYADTIILSFFVSDQDDFFVESVSMSKLKKSVES